MAPYNTVNIKNLNQLEEITSGNLLIVETELGTNIIDFKDFVVGPENVSWYSAFETVSSYTVALSSQLETLTLQVSSDMISLCAHTEELYDSLYLTLSSLTGQFYTDLGIVSSTSRTLLETVSTVAQTYASSVSSNVNELSASSILKGRNVPILDMYVAQSPGDSIGTSFASVFGAANNIPLAAGTWYEIEFYIGFAKATAGSIQLQFSFSPNSFGSISTYSWFTTAGREIGGGGGTGAILDSSFVSLITSYPPDTTLPLNVATLPASKTIMDAVTAVAVGKAILYSGFATSVDINARATAGTVFMIPVSYWKTTQFAPNFNISNLN